MSTQARWWIVLVLLLVTTLAQAGTKHYYYTDPQGTVLAKADAQGNIVATYDYAPYGAQVLGTPPSGPTGYTGHVNDVESGLVYMQARYYDPAVGRFLSVDPISVLKKFSRYTYASNNPIANIDPGGMSDIPFGDCSKNPNCRYAFVSESSGGDGYSTSRESRVKVPTGTPDVMRRYFVSASASDRIKAAMAVADYYGIDRSGVYFFYNDKLHLRAATIKDGPNGDGQLTIGPELFNVSFGLMGAVLSHELEVHWKLQWSLPGMPARDNQSYYMREVQAYRFELSEPSQRRFNLSPDEVQSEQSMLERYYNALTPGNKDMVDHGIYRQL